MRKFYVYIILTLFVFAEANINDDLVAAVENENIPQIKQLLTNGADVNYQLNTAGKRTPLIVAIQKKNLPLINLLIQFKANIILRDSEGFLPIFHAVFSNDVQIIHLLLEHGASLKVKDFKNKSPIYYAIEGMNPQIIKFLLDHGATDHLDEKEKYSLVCLAAQLNLIGIIRLLIRNVKILQLNDPDTLLCTVAKGGYDEIVNILIQEGADVNLENCCSETPLDVAIMYNQTETIKTLLDNNAYFDIDQIKSDFEFDDDISDLKDIIQLLLIHTIKINSLNFKVDKNNLEKCMSPEFEDFMIQSELEVEKMKSTNIHSVYTFSVFDILANSLIRLRKFLEREDSENELKKINLDKEFPIYAGMLKKRIDLGSSKAELYKKARAELRKVLNSGFKIPPECIAEILSYLTEDDLKNIVQPLRSCKLCKSK